QRGYPCDQQLEKPLRVHVYPDLGVRLAAGNAAQIDDRAALAQLRAGLDRDVRAAGGHQRRVDDVGDGHSVVDRRSVEAVGTLVERLEEVRQLGDEAAGAAGSAQTLGVGTAEEGFVRHVEPDHRD